jgi:hypothetical protein
MAKKSEKQQTEEELMNRPAKHHFVKITTNKKKDPRTWVVIYRLVDGPALGPEKAAEHKSTKKKKADTSE